MWLDALKLKHLAQRHLVFLSWLSTILTSRFFLKEIREVRSPSNWQAHHKFHCFEKQNRGFYKGQRYLIKTRNAGSLSLFA